MAEEDDDVEERKDKEAEREGELGRFESVDEDKLESLLPPE